jgi:hypothetical protein
VSSPCGLILCQVASNLKTVFSVKQITPTAAGWLRKSSFADEDDEYIQLVTARKLSSLVIASQSCLYSQWFSGESNTISDSLSRDFHVNETHFQNLLCANFPSQVPFGLNLHPLLNKIVSWVTSLLESRPQKEPWLKEQVRSSFARGSAFNPTSSPLVSSMIPTSRASTGDNDIKSYAHLDNISEKVDLVANLPSFSNLSQSVPPWIAWHRPSSWLPMPIPNSTLMESLHLFYSDNFGDINLPTQERNLKLQ